MPMIRGLQGREALFVQADFQQEQRVLTLVVNRYPHRLDMVIVKRCAENLRGLFLRGHSDGNGNVILRLGDGNRRIFFSLPRYLQRSEIATAWRVAWE
jgi:hypothetical protein